MAGLVHNIILSAGSDSKFLELSSTDGTSIYPGMLVHRTAGNGCARLSGASDLKYPVMVACENHPQGRTPEQPYSLGDTVMVRFLRSGDSFFARSITAIINDAAYVGSNSGVNPGYVITVASAAEAICVALETVSAPPAAFIALEVI